MVFSSTVFLFVFLPIVFGLYCLLPERHMRNALLIVASLLFYAFGEPFVVILMVISIFFNYALGLCMTGKPALRKAALVLAVAGNLGLLGVYKYAGFFVETLNLLPFVELPVPQIPLPIGISFFTFQAMSYVIDAYRGEIQVQKNPARLLLYITFFPQLIAGPIVRYRDIEAQLAYRPMHADKVAAGIRRFILGLSKKLLIADVMAVTVDRIFALPAEQLVCPLAWLGAISYTLQIYFDFSGYSDMAIGLGAMFGFTFKENFNYPYISGSMTEFWRRWHISLSTWFKEYLYIPLGGNRKGKARTILNKWIVFFCTGLWHGAAANFVVWGLLNGMFLTLESSGLIPIEKMQKKRFLRAIGHIYTVIAVVLCFTFFRAETLTQGLEFWRAMVGFGMGDAQVGLSLFLREFSPLFLLALAAAVLFSMPVVPYLKKKCAAPVLQVLAYAGSFVLLAVDFLYLSSGVYSPFIYLNF